MAKKDILINVELNTSKSSAGADKLKSSLSEVTTATDKYGASTKNVQEELSKVNQLERDKLQIYSMTASTTEEVNRAQRKYFKTLDQSAISLEKYRILTQERMKAVREAARAELEEQGLLQRKGKTITDLNVRQRDYNKSLKSKSKAEKQSRTQAGLNNAILLESGRLASDAGYGFTAIANNLSQLISLFGSFQKTAGGFVKSIKQLGASLLGSGGFLIAIQLLIAFGPQIFAFFKRLIGFSTELQDAFKGAAKTIQGTAGSFEAYIRTLQDTTKSQEEQKDAITALKKQFPDFIKQLDEAGVELADIANSTKGAIKQTNLYREAIIKQAIARQAQSKIDEAAGKILELRIEEDMYAFDNAEKFKTKSLKIEAKERLYLREVEAFGEDSMRAKKAKRQLETLKTDLHETKNFNAEKIKEQEGYIDKFLKFIDIENKETEKANKETKKARERNYKQQLLNLDKLEEKFRKESIDRTLMTDEQRIDEQLKNDKIDLRIRVDAFKKRQALRLQEFLESDASDTEKEKAKQEHQSSMIKAEQEYQKVLNQITAKGVTERAKLERQGFLLAKEEYDKSVATRENTEQEAVARLSGTGLIAMDREFHRQRGEFLNDEQKRLQKALQGKIEDISVRADLEAQLFAVQSEISDNNIALAESELAEKQRINMEYVGFASQIGSLLKTLAGESEALQTAALVVEKGAAIAKVVVQAQTAIASRIAGNVALGPVAGPIDLPLMNADIVRTKIGAGLAIANILATTIKNAKKPSGEGGDAGATIQAPDFNVVGASQTSQLAETVAGQQAKPIKAFVVGKDISTQ